MHEIQLDLCWLFNQLMLFVQVVWLQQNISTCCINELQFKKKELKVHILRKYSAHDTLLMLKIYEWNYACRLLKSRPGRMNKLTGFNQFFPKQTIFL